MKSPFQRKSTRKHTPKVAKPEALPFDQAPDDLKGQIGSSRMIARTIGLIHNSTHPGRNAHDVIEAIRFLEALQDRVETDIRTHPRFAEFFPEQAEQAQLAQGGVQS